MTGDMTQGKPLPTLIRFTAPILLGSIFQQIYQMTDMFIVGNVIGSKALASIGAANPVVFPASIIVTGMTTGFTAVSSRCFGAKDAVMLKKSISGAMYISVLFAVIMATAWILGAGPALRLLNTPDDIFADCVLYVRISIGGSAGMVLFGAAASLLRAVGDSRTPLIFMIITSIVNVLLDLLLVWGLNMGVGGAGLALVLSQFAVAVAMIAHIGKRFDIFRFERKDLMPPFRVMWTILFISLPAIVQYLFLSVGDMVVASVVNTYGSNMVAAFSSGNRIIMLSVIFTMNMSVAHSVFAGQNLGAGKLDRIRDAFLKSAALNTLICASAGVLVYIFGGAWVRLLISKADPNLEEIVALTRQLMRVQALFLVALGMIFLYNNTLRGMGMMRAPFLSTLGELLSKVCFAYILTRLMGYAGIWFIYPLGWLLGLLPPVIWFHTGRWRKGRAVGVNGGALP